MSSAHRSVLNRWVAVASVAVGGGFVSFTIASSALAATQIGATFLPDTGYGAGTYLQSVTPAGEYSAPSSGVITKWSYQAGGSPALAIKLKVARSAGGNDFTIVGESPIKNPVLNQLNTYTDVRIPVHAGDIIGLYSNTTNGLLSRDTAGYGYHSLLGTDPPPSNTSTYDATALTSNAQFDVSTTLEADCDGDGLGDETQDPDTSPCKPPSTTAVATGQRAAALKKCRKKHSKKARKKCRKKAQLLPV